MKRKESETIIHIMGPICSEREIKTRPGKGTSMGEEDNCTASKKNQSPCCVRTIRLYHYIEDMWIII